MRYGSVCAGIEAATVAWHSLGWEAAWYSEIEPFPCAVLKHHYPAVPNYGDMTQYEEWPDEPINLLVGGTPCQSFSVAGLRKGLADPRGNLMLTYGAIARRYRPEWLVWENVPGVLSSNGGRDFGTFLGMLAELGYGFAYRVLDAQYFGVAQRRRRVFVVANARSWQRAAAVLFESHSLQGHPAPSREARQRTASSTRGGVELCGPLNARDYKDSGTDGMNHNSAKMVPVVAPTLQANDGKKWGSNQWVDEGKAIVQTMSGEDIAPCLIKRMEASTGTTQDAQIISVSHPITFGAQMSTPQTDVDMVQTLQAKNPMAVAHTLRAEYDASEDGTGRGTPLVPIAQPIPYDFFQITAPVNRQSRQSGDPCHTLARDNAAHATIMQSVAFPWQSALDPVGRPSEISGTLIKNQTMAVQTAMQVRRLTPTECERLQGFPDGYTNIPWRKATESPDGPRYKALGNSMAVPVMAWIGKRIQQVSEL